jgi:hypothetical protein
VLIGVAKLAYRTGARTRRPGGCGGDTGGSGCPSIGEQQAGTDLLWATGLASVPQGIVATFSLWGSAAAPTESRPSVASASRRPGEKRRVPRPVPEPVFYGVLWRSGVLRCYGARGGIGMVCFGSQGPGLQARTLIVWGPFAWISCPGG